MLWHDGNARFSTFFLDMQMIVGSELFGKLKSDPAFFSFFWSRGKGGSQPVNLAVGQKVNAPCRYLYQVIPDTSGSQNPRLVKSNLYSFLSKFNSKSSKAIACKPKFLSHAF